MATFSPAGRPVPPADPTLARAVAVHEAGHAVFGVVHHAPVLGVGYLPGGGGGVLIGPDRRLRSPWQHQFEAVGRLLAGPLATRMAGLEAPGRWGDGGQVDYCDAQDRAARVCRTEGEVLRFVEAAHDRADRVVRAYWPTVVRLADAIRTERWVAGDDVRAMLAGRGVEVPYSDGQMVMLLAATLARMNELVGEAVAGQAA